MLSSGAILLASFGYLGILFAIAYYGDLRADRGRSIISNPYIYTLSIAVYCTAWTYYGSVGRAAAAGASFLPIYLGPTLMAALWWVVLRKIVRIAKEHRITSIADFISSRYGKSALLGGLVTVIAVVGIMPYISLQLKAISISYQVLSNYPGLVPSVTDKGSMWTDTAFYVAMILAAFTIVFGTRHIDATERHEGMVAAIAFESVVKLLAFLSVGVFVTFGLFDGPLDLFERAFEDPELRRLMTIEGTGGDAISWLSLTFLAMMAVLFLPRQFQVAVVENVNEDHLRKAAWLFPLYLLIINLFVLPIALGGRLEFPGGAIDPDTFVLTLPMAEHARALALIVYIGGLSAATGMVIVATISLSTMVCNDLVMPALLRIRTLGFSEYENFAGLLLLIRRLAIVGVLLMGYTYYRLIGESYTLVTIGLVSFAAAAQFGPAILIGIYWKGATRSGAVAALLSGFGVWAYTLLLPGFARSGWVPGGLLESGPFGIELLHPYRLFGLEGLDPISHAVLWSMLANVGCLVAVSLFTRQTALEKIQATLFADVFHTARGGETAYRWGGTTSFQELYELVKRFLGEARTDRAFQRYARERNLDLSAPVTPDPHFIHFTERMLAGAIGAASARVMVSTTVRGEALSIENVMEILDETSQVLEYSHRLEEKSQELERATSELRAANDRLQELDRLKDEFVATVSHELRTPLTSIRAFSEILLDNLDMERGQRGEFLRIVVRETERLTRLINDLLDLAKIESGRMEWHPKLIDVREVIRDAVNAVSQLFKEKSVLLEQELPQQSMLAEVDADRITQVIINLLSNARKFSNAEQGRVGISLRREGDQLRIEVTDNGPGVPEGQFEAVFDKFHQAQGGDGEKPTGTGLGLPISRGIIEYHGGRIWVENRNGGGARFCCLLPAHDAGAERPEELRAQA